MTHHKKRFIIFSLILGINTLYANVNTVVSILPQKTFVEAIGGEKVNVALMVKPGSSPHSYEPKPSQMIQIGKADIYFAIGVEFENVWLSKFSNQNKTMKIAHMDEGIHKIEMDNHHDHDEHAHHEDKKEEKDPHIWTSPLNVKRIAKNIYDQLIAIDEKNKTYYRSNYEAFLTHITKTDEKIKNILNEDKTKRKFMVFHPAWGYFSKEYDLTQIAIEISGKNPKPRQVMQLIKEAKAQKVNAVFTAPEFNEKTAQIIAKEVGVPVVKISPLAPNWSQNLINLANTIVHK